MSSLLRLLTIIKTFARYRLDTLAPKQAINKKYLPLLWFCKLYPLGDQSRGQRLRLALEELGPIFVKFGQLLSTRPDLIPHDIVDELSHLQDNVAPFDSQHFIDLVEKALDDKIDDVFIDFEQEPLGSASVAQVHAAKLKNGDDVIIKAIRPGIEHTIEKDTKLLLRLAKIVEKIAPDGKRLRPVEVVEDYRNTIFDELNLSLEASNASQLRRNFEASDKLYVPKVYWPYSRSNVMVMERIYGIPVTDINILEKQNTNMKVLAERGVEIFFTQVFEHNFFHADMHPGNIFVSHNDPERPSYIAVDMAIVGSLTREDQYYLARNLIAMFRRDYRQVAELHVNSGWVPKGTSVTGFESAIRAVCEPVFELPLKEISFGEALITIFRTAQRYNMPVQPQLVLLQKTLLNIEGLGRQLYPDLNLWDTAHPFLERWIKQRYQPKTLWKEFRYYAPEWLEKLPEIPHLLLESLDDIKHISQVSDKIEKNELAHTENNKKKLKLKVASVLLAITGVALSYPFESMSPASPILFLVSLMLLLSL
ncbi:MAG: ubiquinone biosynthesis regulatory protein kinase UbiB [Agarilytica sp.]